MEAARAMDKRRVLIIGEPLEDDGMEAILGSWLQPKIAK